MRYLTNIVSFHFSLPLQVLPPNIVTFSLSLSFTHTHTHTYTHTHTHTCTHTQIYPSPLYMLACCHTYLSPLPPFLPSLSSFPPLSLSLSPSPPLLLLLILCTHTLHLVFSPIQQHPLGGPGAMLYPGKGSAWQPVVTSLPSMVDIPKESIIANTDFTTTSVIAKR